MVDQEERAAIAAMTESGELSHDEVERVFARFVERKWGEAMQDGVLSPQERLLLVGIIRELKVPEARVPPMLRMALFSD